MKKKDIFKEMAEAWGRPLVPRMNVDEFSGGLLHPRTMANLDSLGEGPKRKVKMGRKLRRGGTSRGPRPGRRHRRRMLPGDAR